MSLPTMEAYDILTTVIGSGPLLFCDIISFRHKMTVDPILYSCFRVPSSPITTGDQPTTIPTSARAAGQNRLMLGAPEAMSFHHSAA